jgi:hypothetical protein
LHRSSGLLTEIIPKTPSEGDVSNVLTVAANSETALMKVPHSAQGLEALTFQKHRTQKPYTLLHQQAAGLEIKVKHPDDKRKLGTAIKTRLQLCMTSLKFIDWHTCERLDHRREEFKYIEPEIDVL